VLARSFVGIFADANGSTAGESVLAEDFVAYLPYSRYSIRGRGKYGNWMKQFRSGFSNFQCDIDELIDDGMRVAVRWTWSGTHTGNLLGIAPTNRKIEFTETHLLRFPEAGSLKITFPRTSWICWISLGRLKFAAA
jgi:predicted ester cyclase